MLFTDNDYALEEHCLWNHVRENASFHLEGLLTDAVKRLERLEQLGMSYFKIKLHFEWTAIWGLY